MGLENSNTAKDVPHVAEVAIEAPIAEASIGGRDLPASVDDDDRDPPKPSRKARRKQPDNKAAPKVAKKATRKKAAKKKAKAPAKARPAKKAKAKKKARR